MNFSWAFIFDTTGYVVKALPLTLFLTIFPVTAGLVLGFLLALLKMYRVPVTNRLVSIYVSFFRSIPLLVLLFLVYSKAKIDIGSYHLLMCFSQIIADRF